MKFKNLALVGAALLLSAPVFGSTYFGGFEDTVGGDYDYNDIVFSISGNGLTLNSAGKYYSQPVLDNSGTPFWNNTSFDQPAKAYNVGYCIYGGGACNGGKALDAGAQFLASASSPKVSAKDVTFTVNGGVNANITLGITAGTDSLGYYLLSDPTHVYKIGGVGNTYSFAPGGSFGLVGMVSNLGNTFYSQTSLGTQDCTSHFAFFNSTAPEPGMMSLVGTGLLSVGALLRRRKTAANRS